LQNGDAERVLRPHVAAFKKAKARFGRDRFNVRVLVVKNLKQAVTHYDHFALLSDGTKSNKSISDSNCVALVPLARSPGEFKELKFIFSKTTNDRRTIEEYSSRFEQAFSDALPITRII
jgi:hypothetical protein